MNVVKIEEEKLGTKWKKSILKINQLLKERNGQTVRLVDYYKLYINNPFDETIKDMFVYSFNSWYKQYMEG